MLAVEEGKQKFPVVSWRRVLWVNDSVTKYASDNSEVASTVENKRQINKSSRFAVISSDQLVFRLWEMHFAFNSVIGDVLTCLETSQLQADGVRLRNDALWTRTFTYPMRECFRRMWKDCGGSGCGIFQCNMLSFAWRWDALRAGQILDTRTS